MKPFGQMFRASAGTVASLGRASSATVPVAPEATAGKIRAMPSEKPANFEEFWPYYVSQHMNPACRKLHFVGTGLALANLAISPLFPPAALAAPLYGYGFAWVGHVVFEKNEPARWMGPRELVWSLRSNFCMFRKMIDGSMGAEVERIRRTRAEQQAAEAEREHGAPGVTA